MSIKRFSMFSSGGYVVRQSRNYLGNFGRSFYEKYLREVILNSGQHLRRRCFKI